MGKIKPKHERSLSEIADAMMDSNHPFQILKLDWSKNVEYNYGAGKHPTSLNFGVPKIELVFTVPKSDVVVETVIKGNFASEKTLELFDMLTEFYSKNKGGKNGNSEF